MIDSISYVLSVNKVFDEFFTLLTENIPPLHVLLQCISILFFNLLLSKLSLHWKLIPHTNQVLIFLLLIFFPETHCFCIKSHQVLSCGCNKCQFLFLFFNQFICKTNNFFSQARVNKCFDNVLLNSHRIYSLFDIYWALILSRGWQKYI